MGKSRIPSRSFMVASLRLAFPRTPAASSHCLRLVGYSLPVRECFTLELVMRMTRLGSARGMAVASRDLRPTAEECVNYTVEIPGCQR